APPSAEIIARGNHKRDGGLTQEQLTELTLSRARAGKTVVRLKGGDPFVFGRGGEEAEALAAEGIEFEVVPGVSSVIAAPASAGIPLTHRDHSSSFAVVTGSEATTKNGRAIPWRHLGESYETLVFLMGVKNIALITDRLIEAGKKPDTPAAVIRWGARPDQETVVA